MNDSLQLAQQSHNLDFDPQKTGDALIAPFPLRISTKLYRPPVTEDYLPRPKIQPQLDRIRQRPFSLLSAPAGYGKTTLLSAWLENCDCPSAWLSLDENDNHLAIFLAYFLAAIRSMFPQVGENTQAVLGATARPPLSAVTNSLIMDLNQIETDFVLVLDDYHTIGAQDIHFLLGELLHHPHRSMHLVIATRHDPPLPLSPLRARNQITELRAQDLRFSTEEIAVFMQQTLGSPLEDKTISILEEGTEGWPAGLRLASLSLRHSRDLDKSIAGLKGINRYIIEYLGSEVISHLSPAMQDLIIATSVLDRMCAPLFEAVTGLDDPEWNGQTCLEWLEDTNLFTVPLDGQRIWYRFHHLFRDFLRNHLTSKFTPGQIAALHSRASTWLAQNGLVEEAIDHALLSGEIRNAVRLVETHRHEQMNQEQWLRLETWLSKFPESVINVEPDLLILSAWINQSRQQLDKAWITVERIKTLMTEISLDPEEILRLQNSLDVFLCIKYNWEGDFQQVIFHARRALERTPGAWNITRSYAWLHLMIATLSSSGLKQALAVLAEAQEEDFFDPHQTHTRVRSSACFVYWMAADLPNLIQTANYILQAAHKNHLLETTGWMNVFAASGYYQQNNLPEAERHFSSAVEWRYASHPTSFAQGAIGLAKTYQAQGKPDKASQTVDLAIQFCLEMGYAPQLQTLKTFLAELNLLQGETGKAVSWAELVDPSLPLQIMPYFFDQQLTLPRVLLAQNTSASLQKAFEVLSRMLDFVNATHNNVFLIEVLALQALLYNLLGNEQASFNALTKSVQLAQPGGFIRVFVDLGPQMANLLNRLSNRGVVPEYIAKILGAFPALKPAVSSAGLEEIVAPLTGRELEILVFLAQRLSNKEIASELVISPITVKRHTINIYQKLNVKSRREAVDMAVALGILGPR
jgi:LuxR family transcriptional regulator, maltose regulon positive regulatory protein